MDANHTKRVCTKGNAYANPNFRSHKHNAMHIPFSTVYIPSINVLNILMFLNIWLPVIVQMANASLWCIILRLLHRFTQYRKKCNQTNLTRHVSSYNIQLVIHKEIKNYEHLRRRVCIAHWLPENRTGWEIFGLYMTFSSNHVKNKRARRLELIAYQKNIAPGC